MKNKHKPKVIGQTVEGNYVIGNYFFIVESRGVPIEDVVDFFYSRKYKLCWVSFIEDARKMKWLDKTIFLKLKYGLEESNLSLEEKTIIINKISDYILKTIKKE